jgi:hypothetical protein
MSRLPLTFVLIAAATGMVGCATSPAPVASPVDAKYMTAVENAAERTGTRVIWIHPPEKVWR